MLMKRLYDIPDGWEPQRNERGELLNPLPVAALSLKHTGTNPEQNFSRRMVDAGLQEGWLSMARGTLTLHTTEDDLAYTILKTPGTYCCHCDMRLDDDPSGASNRQHVEREHPGEASPDPANPAWYRVTNAYECVLDEAQHARWMRPEYATVSHARWKEETHTTNGTGETAGQAPRAQRKRASRAAEPAPTPEEDGEEEEA